MRERLSSKFVTFNKVKGKEVYKDFFENGKLQNEEGVESAYNYAHQKATNSKVKVLKRTAPKRGKTDGYIEAQITIKEEDVVNFCGLQEVKLNIKRTSVAYKYQIAQALLYAVQYPEDQIKFIVIPSVNYIDYFFMDDIEINKEELLQLLEKEPPSKACKYVNLPKMNIHRMDMPTGAEIDEMWKTIYRHCIEV